MPNAGFATEIFAPTILSGDRLDAVSDLSFVYHVLFMEPTLYYFYLFWGLNNKNLLRAEAQRPLAHTYNPGLR